MHDFTQASIEKIVIHRVGNKMKDEELICSPSLYPLIDSNIKELLLKYFLSSFKRESYYRFSHDSNIKLNEVCSYVEQIFIDRSAFLTQSINIAKHLYRQSSHPQIKSGELYIVYFTNCILNGKCVDVVGIFKSENRDIYLKVDRDGDNFKVFYENGININKLDKGCLIYNDNPQDGYCISIVDNVNSAKEAKYWTEDFLNISLIEDVNLTTDSYLKIIKKYSNEVSPDKVEQIRYIDNAMSYLESNKTFDIQEFTQVVFEDKSELIDGFNKYKRDFENKNGVHLQPGFTISDNTMAKANRVLSNIIKLDTDIEITVRCTSNLSHENLIKGFDEDKKMFFYKAYFNNEKK